MHFSNICKLLSVTAKEKLLGRKHQVFCAFLLLPKHTYSPGYLDGRTLVFKAMLRLLPLFLYPPHKGIVISSSFHLLGILLSNSAFTNSLTEWETEAGRCLGHGKYQELRFEPPGPGLPVVRLPSWLPPFTLVQLEVLEAHGCKGEGGLPGGGSAGAWRSAVGYSEARLANNTRVAFPLACVSNIFTLTCTK